MNASTLNGYGTRIVSLLIALSLLAGSLSLSGCGEPSTEPPSAPATKQTTPAPEPERKPPSPSPRPARGGPAQITFTETEFDFGRTSDALELAHTFSFTNTGGSTLVVREIKSSCTCTLATLEKASYAPGETGEITATFNPSHPGPQRQKITLLTNTTPGSTELGISAVIQPFARVTSRVIKFGEVEAGVPHTVRFDVFSPDKNAQAVEFSSNNEHISAAVIEHDATRGRTTIGVTLDDSAPWGMLSTSRLYFTMKGQLEDGQAAARKMEMFVVGTVYDEFRAVPARVGLGILDPGQEFAEEVKISHESGQPFTITSATVTPHPLVDVRVEVAEDVESFYGGYKLIVTGRMGREKGIVSTLIQFVAVPDGGEGTVREISLVGQIGRK